MDAGRDSDVARRKATKLVCERKSVICPVMQCWGITKSDEISLINEAAPDLCAFVVDDQSKQGSVDPMQLSLLVRQLCSSIPAVGIFVDKPPRELAGLVAAGSIDIIQLAGHEDEAYLFELRTALMSFGVRRAPIMKTFYLEDAEDVSAAEQSTADLVVASGKDNLMDAKDALPFLETGQLKRDFIVGVGDVAADLAVVLKKIKPYGVSVSLGSEFVAAESADHLISTSATIRSTEYNNS